LRRSDNWPFLQRGVPAVFLTTGLHPDYHTPADDTDRLDFAKLERITELASRVAWITADGDAPRFKGK
jgi:Zn-dependent M28 family amino/carboxypeptidase